MRAFDGNSAGSVSFSSGLRRKNWFAYPFNRRFRGWKAFHCRILNNVSRLQRRCAIEHLIAILICEKHLLILGNLK